MAPTIQNGSNNQNEKRPQRPVEKNRSELLTRVKYCNTLPDIPFDLKFITYPFPNDRFVQYNPTSLERNFKYEVLTEHDLGVTIDLINRDLYQSDPYSPLDPADEKLLEEDVHTPQDSMRSRHHSRSVSWLRKSEYISTEQTRFQPQTMEKVEAKVGFNVRKAFVEETLYMDRDAQIKSIQKTFEENKLPITKHYSKPGVTAVEVLDVYPDFVNWKYPCAQVIFDSDPAPVNKNIPAQIEEMSQAMIRGVMDESGEQFVAYFLPTDETLEKRRLDLINEIAYVDDQEYEYKMAREYNWNVKSKASKGYEENYFLIMRQDGIYYNELETRVRLSKRRQNISQQTTNTKLVVKHVPLNASEHKMQRYRERQLEPAREEEEELEESEPEEEEEEVIQPTATPAAEDKASEEKEDDKKESGHKSDNESDHSVKSKSRSRSKSHSKSKSKSKSRSRSKSGSRSRSRSGSRSVSRSRSRSPHSKTSRSRSASKSPSRSRSRSHSGSRSKSRSRSGSKEGSKSPGSNHSGSAKSRSRSKSGSRSRSGSKIRSPSRNRSNSHSPSVDSKHSKKFRRSRKSKSRGRTTSRSPMSTRSGTRTPSHSSGSDSE